MIYVLMRRVRKKERRGGETPTYIHVAKIYVKRKNLSDLVYCKVKSARGTLARLLSYTSGCGRD